MIKGQSIRMLASKAKTGKDLVRNETFQGREYLVVPVVALVEGVIQGAAADVPELALASEFGKVPQGWDGRPLVMNHPKVNGEFVSANSPSILEDWSVGFIFNSQVEDGKLKTEAWIDVELAKEKGGDFESTLERVQEGETVEVSTGLFTDTVSKKGKFNGKSYKAVWANVVPDHLALLSEGVIGACSVSDGCGTHRTNAMKQVAASSCGGECQCGGSCMCEKPSTAVPITPNTETTESTAETIETTETPTETSETTEEVTVSEAEAPEDIASRVNHLVANSIEGSITLSDALNLLRQALRKKFPAHYYWVIHATAEVVVFEGSAYGDYYQVGYTMDGDGNVEFNGDLVPVNVLTRIVPKANGLKSNSGAQNEGQPAQKAETMTDTTVSTETPATPKVHTVESYLAEAPSEIREALSSGLKMHQEKRKALIEGIKANKANKFTDEQLNGFEMNVLENLASLASVEELDYSGRAVPAPTVNNRETDYTPAPRVFEAKQA